VKAIVATVLIPIICMTIQRAESAPTFLGGRELAERLLHNVVAITAHGQRGMGFVVGGDGRVVQVVTAYHVLKSVDDSTGRGRVDVTFCGNDNGRAVASAVQEILFEDKKADLIAFSVRAPREYTWEHAALAPPKKTAPGDRVWSVGREGTCKVGGLEGAIDQTRDDLGNLVIDVPQGFPGTSGSIVVSERGIVGMSYVESAATLVRARAVGHIQELVGGRVDWSLTEADNYPPTTIEAAQVELTRALNRYVFCLKDVRDQMSKERYRNAELTQAVIDYNAAILAFNDTRDKYDGTIVRAGGAGLLQRFARVRATIDRIHPKFLDMNAFMEQLRKNHRVRDNRDVVPAEIRQRMTEISPLVAELDTAIRQFVVDLNAGAEREIQISK
jgi:hypothetical protein